MGAYFDSLRILWYRRVVKFDRAQQRELAGGVKGAGIQLFESVNETIYAGFTILKSWFAIIWSGGLWLMLIRLAFVGIVIAMAIRWLPQILSRLSTLRFMTTRNDDPIRR